MKTFVHMLGFNTPEMIRGALENFSATVDCARPDLEKILFSCSFPLPSADENREALEHLATSFGWRFEVIENRGVAKNWEQAVFNYFKPTGDDVVVGFDPDVRMRSKGWLPAMETILRTDPDTVFVAGDRPYYEEEWCKSQHGFSTRRTSSGIEVSEFRALVAWSMGAYRGDWLVGLGEIDADNKIYGYGEHWMLRRMIQRQKKWVVARGFMDDHLPAGKEYSEWKLASAQHRTALKFEDWIKK